MVGLINIEVSMKGQIKPLPGLRVPAGGNESGNRPGTYAPAGPSAQIQANRDVALYLQGQVVDRMKSHIANGGRGGASTGRLVNATLDARNVHVTKEFIGVGMVDHLNNANVKYWRTFEEGSAATFRKPFTGTLLFGMKGASFPSRHGQVPGLRTTSRARLEELLRKAEDDPKPRKSSGHYFVVTHEIAPAHIYSTVAAENKGEFKNISLQFARRTIQEAFSNQIVAAPPGYVPGPGERF